MKKTVHISRENERLMMHAPNKFVLRLFVCKVYKELILKSNQLVNINYLNQINSPACNSCVNLDLMKILVPDLTVLGGAVLVK